MEQRLKNLNLWVWRYVENERNYPGLHLTADLPACETLRDVLRTLRADGDWSHRTLLLKALNPEDEAKITGGQRFKHFSKLHLKLSAPSADLQFMSATHDSDVVDLEFTPEYLDRFEKRLTDVARGRGDYAIGPPDEKKIRKNMRRKDLDSLDLWFWPCFGHLHPIP